MYVLRVYLKLFGFAQQPNTVLQTTDATAYATLHVTVESLLTSRARGVAPVDRLRTRVVIHLT